MLPSYNPRSLAVRGHYVLIWLVLGLIGLIPFCRKGQSDWYNVYIPAAQRLLAGENLFEQGFVYPPVAAGLAVPWLALPPLAGRVLWYLFSLTVLYILWAASWRLTGGRLERSAGTDWREHVIALFGGIFGLS